MGRASSAVGLHGISESYVCYLFLQCVCCVRPCSMYMRDYMRTNTSAAVIILRIYKLTAQIGYQHICTVSQFHIYINIRIR